MLHGRQSNYDLTVGFQGISDKINSKPMSRSAIKEIITEEKVPGSEEVIKTLHSGQQSVIHNFYENLYKHKPCNDDPGSH